MATTTKPFQFNLGNTIGTNSATKTEADKVTASTTISKPFQFNTENSSNAFPAAMTAVDKLKLPVTTMNAPFQFNTLGVSASTTAADKSKISFGTSSPFGIPSSQPQLSTAKAIASDSAPRGKNPMILHYCTVYMHINKN